MHFWIRPVTALSLIRTKPKADWIFLLGIKHHWLAFYEHMTPISWAIGIQSTVAHCLCLSPCSRVLPSKLPWRLAWSSSLVWVCRDGLKTNTPELKQSGQPGSGAADSSSLSNSSSTLHSTWGDQRSSKLTSTQTPSTLSWHLEVYMLPLCRNRRHKG